MRHYYWRQTDTERLLSLSGKVGINQVDSDGDVSPSHTSPVLSHQLKTCPIQNRTISLRLDGLTSGGGGWYNEYLMGATRK